MKKIKYLAIVILFLASLSLMYYSFKINITPPYGKYVFDTHINGEKNSIGAFQLSFDFDSQTGSIEFEYRDSLPTSITIEIPNELKIENVVAKKGETSINDKFSMTELSASRIVLHSFQSPMKYVDFKFYFRVRAEQEIYPNGLFIINTYGAENIYNKDERSGTDGEDRVKFHLGKYICNVPCFYERVNSSETVMNNYNIIRSPPNTQQNRFIISTYDSRKNMVKRMIEGIGIGLLISSVVFFLQIFINSDESRRAPG